jgi:hypothetical protein
LEDIVHSNKVSIFLNRHTIFARRFFYSQNL